MKLFASVASVIAFVAVVATGSPAHAGTRLIMQSTTSTQNTGLFDVLLPAYYKWTKLKDVNIDVVAVGTGKAIENARRGDADILLVHDREKEDAFIADGFGVNRHDLMYNDFIVVGPASDPAKVKAAKTASDAFARMAKAGVQFVSRGDESGTHAKEKKLWKAAGVDVAKLKGYLSVGQGMEDTLRITVEKGAYTLSDRATYQSMRDHGLKGVTLLFEGDKAMFNQYGIMAVNPAKHPAVHYKEAMDFINFVTGPDGQKVIGNFRDKAGNSLFVPNAK
ncbi:MAG: substrate-binding domain-containing protein [Nitrospirae bacterium]|nr:substrate-binding domain-containing protein [Nitrospirota bacterium]